MTFAVGHGWGSHAHGSRSNGPSLASNHCGVIHESVVVSDRVWDGGAIISYFLFFFRAAFAALAFLRPRTTFFRYLELPACFTSPIRFLRDPSLLFKTVPPLRVWFGCLLPCSPIEIESVGAKDSRMTGCSTNGRWSCQKGLRPRIRRSSTGAPTT